jgi:phosphoglycerate dehydrogenase-like enzyme
MPTHPTVLLLLATTDALIDGIRPALSRAGIAVEPELLRGAEYLLCEHLPGNLDDCDALKWVQLASAGYSQIFGLPLVTRGIRVSNGLGNFDIPMAEWNVMMLLVWQRRLLEMLDHQQPCCSIPLEPD